MNEILIFLSILAFLPFLAIGVQIGTEGAAPATVNLYVNGSTGSDTNTGYASGSAKATLAAALNLIPSLLMNNYVINVADATYAEVIEIRRFMSVGSGSIKIAGNTTTPANVSFTGSSSMITLNGSLSASCIAVEGVVNVEFEGIRVNATSTFGALIAYNANVIFDRCTVTGTLTTGVRASNNASLNFQGNCTISGFASTSGRGLAIHYNTICTFTVAGTLTITGNATPVSSYGVHMLGHSKFLCFTTATNITVTSIQIGFQLGFGCAFTHQGGSSTVTITNGSAPSGSKGVQATDASSWSSSQQVTMTFFDTGFEANSQGYIEVGASRTLTSLGATSSPASSSSTGGLCYLI
jgi:hypothetical protein